MRRFWATLLLAISALSLVAPALFAIDAQSTLAACCRRGGRHRCVMQDEAPGNGVRLVSTRCPLFPAARALPATGQSSPALNRAAIVVATVISHPALHPQSSSPYRISFDRAAQKRGPPSVS